ncbi:hypothetical protein BIW11_09747, partial [Tropilaelaps mercedesae]
CGSEVRCLRYALRDAWVRIAMAHKETVFTCRHPAVPNSRLSPIVVLIFILVNILLNTQLGSGRSIPLTKRAAFYIANGTVCNVDGIIYQNNEKIPTDNPCEVCYCRPPGFACILKDCELKPHCKAVRREGQCCPDYHCDGCEHDGQFFSDGQVIPNTGSPCYTCYCQGSSISCSLVSCTFRNDCTARYNPGECCPRYDHCPPKTVNTTETLEPARLPTTLFQSRLMKFKSRTSFKAQLPATSTGASGQILIHHNGLEFVPTSPPPVRPTLYLTGFTVPDRENEIDNNNSNSGSNNRQSPPSVRVPLSPNLPRDDNARTSDDKVSVHIDGRENEADGSESSGGSVLRKVTSPSTTTSRAESTLTTTTPATTTTAAAATTTTTAPIPTTASTIRTTTKAPALTTPSTTPSTTTSITATTTSTTPAPVVPTTRTTTTPTLPPTTMVTARMTTELFEPDIASLTGSPRTAHVSEEDVHRIDDVTHKLTAVTKSIYNKASSGSSGTIDDWELEEFRRAVELLETHYRNFYDRVQNTPSSSTEAQSANKHETSTEPLNLRRRDDLPFLNQDMIDALFAEEHQPVKVPEETVSGDQTTPLPQEGTPLKTADGLEDLIIPKYKPLLGPGDTDARAASSVNATAGDAEQFLRVALEEDDARRKAIALERLGSSDDAAITPPEARTAPAEAQANDTAEATTAMETTSVPPAIKQIQLHLSNDTATTTPLEGDEIFHELMQPSIVAAVGAPGTSEPQDKTTESKGEVALRLPHQFALRSDDIQLGKSSSQTSPSAQASCTLTGQLSSLLETLSRTSRSQDPVLDFLKRAIHSHAIMHPDDVKTFMKSKDPWPQPVHETKPITSIVERQFPESGADGGSTQR